MDIKSYFTNNFKNKLERIKIESNYISKHIKKIIVVIFIVIIIIIIYYFLTRYSGYKLLFDNYDYFYNDRIEYVGAENMKDSEEGIKYTFSIWIRIENVSANAHWYTDDKIPKTILYNHGSPNILYLRKENIVRIQISYLNMDGFLENYNFDLEDFENQIWTNLIITVNNRNVKIFKNGELYTSKMLPHVNLRTYKLLTIGEENNNLNGYIGFLEYFNYIIDENKIKEIYNNRKKKLPYKVMSYEYYEYLRKKKEEEESQIIPRFKNFIM